MKRIALILISLILISCGSKEKYEPPFYEITNSTATVYLLGSLHSSDGSIFPLPDYIMTAYNKSDAIYFEYVKTPADPMMRNRLYLKEGENLQNYISEDTYSLIKYYARINNLNLNFLLQLNTITCAEFITTAELNKFKITAEKGTDTFFRNISKARNIPINGLETYSNFIKYFDLIDMKEQDMNLQETLKDYKRIAPEAIKLIKLWKEGNLEELQKFSLESTANMPSFYKNVISARNSSLVQGINNSLKERKTAFIIAGVAHLPGDVGILEQLKKMGYSVKKVTHN